MASPWAHRIRSAHRALGADTPPPGERGREPVSSDVRRTTADLIRLDGLYGGGAVLHLAVGAANRAAETPAPDGGPREHMSAVSEAEQVAGWAAYDADRQDLCARFTERALHTATLAGDRPAELMALSQLAMWAVQTEDAAYARRVSDDALTNALPPRVRVLFEVRLARALALHGERARALTVMRRARSRFGEGSSHREPAWAWWVDDAELGWHHGMIHAGLGEWDHAADLFAASCARRPPGRGRYNDAAHLTAALVVTRRWTKAEQVVAAEVIPAAPVTASLRTRHLLDRITARVPAAPRTDTLRQMLQAAVRAAPIGQ
ncbi:hypothetical protein [Nocardiopsis trehalosi]|uniref:hypothetical protein n=1 Tax=Nocardiopsis trehalosi TaxID=109329 RepID=UPI0008297593|nr:hypothetical protein [Nocardiopsis trehalosi]